MAHCNSKPKKMEKGGPAAPIMPKEAKLRRKKRSMAQDTTEKPPRSAYKAMGFTDAELKKMGMKDGGSVNKKRSAMLEESGRTISDADLARVNKMRLDMLMGEAGKTISRADKARAKKVMGYKNGGCVMSGRGGKFKGIS